MRTTKKLFPYPNGRPVKSGRMPRSEVEKLDVATLFPPAVVENASIACELTGTNEHCGKLFQDEFPKWFVGIVCAFGLDPEDNAPTYVVLYQDSEMHKYSEADMHILLSQEYPALVAGGADGDEVDGDGEDAQG